MLQCVIILHYNQFNSHKPYSQTLLSQTEWDCLKTSKYLSIRDNEGEILKK